MSKNFREGAAITREYTLLSATSPESAFEALALRWDARVTEANALSDRFEEPDRQ